MSKDVMGGTPPPDTIDSEVEQILDDIPGDWQIFFEAKENAHTAITNLIAQEANKAVKKELEWWEELINWPETVFDQETKAYLNAILKDRKALTTEKGKP